MFLKLNMKTILREDSGSIEFGRDMKPEIKVEVGESFKIETWDPYKGRFFDHGMGDFTADDIPVLNSPPPGLDVNPVSGPVYIDGAESGDTLAVHVEDIRPQRAFTATLEGFGNLSGRKGWDECQVNRAHEIELKPGPSGTTADGSARLEINGHQWEWDLNPHIGTIATAPGRTVQEPATTQGPWGGNMDVRDLKKGSTVYLNSYNEGGLLFAGDVHASQGGAEYTGLAVETYSDIVLSVEIVDKEVPGVFRIEDEDHLVHIDSTRNAGNPYEAIDNCFISMMNELVNDYGYSEREVYLQMSVNPAITTQIYQFVQPGFFTVGVKADKSIIRDSPATSR